MEIHAPFAGIVHYQLPVDSVVEAGETIATVETLKLEAPVVAPGPGVISSWSVKNYADVIGGQVIAIVKEAK